MASLDQKKISTDLLAALNQGLQNIAVTDANAAQALYVQYSQSYATLLLDTNNPNVAARLEDLKDQFIADLGAIGIQDQAIAEQQIGAVFGVINQLALAWLSKLVIAAAAA